MAKKVFGIFNIPKKTGPILPSLPDLKEHLQNVQLVIVHNTLDLGDLDSGPAKPILEVSIIFLLHL